MTCKEMVEFLMAYLDDELDSVCRSAFEEHLGECPDCMAYLDTYRETIQLVSGMSEPVSDETIAEMPEDLVQAILAAHCHST